MYRRTCASKVRASYLGRIVRPGMTYIFVGRQIQCEEAITILRIRRCTSLQKRHCHMAMPLGDGVVQSCVARVVGRIDRTLVFQEQVDHGYRAHGGCSVKRILPPSITNASRCRWLLLEQLAGQIEVILGSHEVKNRLCLKCQSNPKVDSRTPWQVNDRFGISPGRCCLCAPMSANGKHKQERRGSSTCLVNVGATSQQKVHDFLCIPNACSYHERRPATVILQTPSVGG